MGKIQKGILGGFVGQVGNVIGKQQRGLNIVTKSKGRLDNKTNVTAQPQVERMVLINECLSKWATELSMARDVFGLMFEFSRVNAMIKVSEFPIRKQHNGYEYLTFFHKNMFKFAETQCDFNASDEFIQLRFKRIFRLSVNDSGLRLMYYVTVSGYGGFLRFRNATALNQVWVNWSTRGYLSGTRVSITGCLINGDGEPVSSLWFASTIID